ncbi:Protein of unknown function [Gryllus bimaculatus]|nr:Protein of unknown function [Gryllus bimaculatus]
MQLVNFRAESMLRCSTKTVVSLLRYAEKILTVLHEIFQKYFRAFVEKNVFKSFKALTVLKHCGLLFDLSDLRCKRFSSRKYTTETTSRILHNTTSREGLSF